MDFDFLLQDRLQKIQQMYTELDLKQNGYISFSGGKDSMVLHTLMDMAVPENKIPRVYANTGMEYLEQVKFVKRLAEKDSRIQIIPPSKNIRETLERVGYPFKSKYHSRQIHVLQNTGLTESLKKYFDPTKNTPHSCPAILRYQATEPLPFKVSDRCCTEFKKKPMHEWELRNHRRIGITGLRAGEKGTREKVNCLSYRNKTLVRFNPLLPCLDEWVDDFVKRYSVELSPLYLPPVNFKRTGCKGCPFNVHLVDDLLALLENYPAEFKACRSLWRPVYSEYERLGYRLKRGTFAIQLELDE